MHKNDITDTFSTAKKRTVINQKFNINCAVFILSALYFLIFNLPLIKQDMLTYSLGATLETVCNSFLFTASLFLLFTFRPTVTIIGSVFLFASSTLAWYGAVNFKITFSLDLIQAVMEATSEEMHTILSMSLLGYLIVALSASLLLITWVIRYTYKPPYYHKGLIIACFFTLFIFFTHSSNAIMRVSYYPFNYLYPAVDYIGSSITRLAYQSYRHTMQQPPAPIEARRNNNDPLIVVVVIGEAARADHFHMQGYSRQTTPQLERIPHLISYTNTTSCAATTAIAVPCILAGQIMPRASTTPPPYSFIDIFNHLGFTTSWIGVQGTHSVLTFLGETAIVNYADKATTTLFLGDRKKGLVTGTEVNAANPDDIYGTLDEEALPYVQQFLEGKEQHKLLVLHTMGSHASYSYRYPSQFNSYKPTCDILNKKPKECPTDHLVNAYDNTILYTDHILSTIITMLKPYNALFVYSSDHGESLGEDGYYLHGNMERPEERHVPMIWWASDQFRKKYPLFYNQLRSHHTQATEHKHLFHSLLGCAGVVSPLIDNKHNLCDISH